MNNDFINLVDFWNKCFDLSPEERKETFEKLNPNEDYKKLAPSQKQYDVISSLFKSKNNVLDYGCGDGWASIIMAKTGIKKVTSVDVSQNSIELVKCYSKSYGIESILNALHIDENWLKTQDDQVYDGFFSSNVIDVIPLDMAKEIIEQSARLLKKGSVAIFSLNYYIDPEIMRKNGHTVDGKNIYIDGVLRLSSLKDEEWTEIFSNYYEIKELLYYAWPNETKETRRLFVLEKR